MFFFFFCNFSCSLFFVAQALGMDKENEVEMQRKLKGSPFVRRYLAYAQRCSDVANARSFKFDTALSHSHKLTNLLEKKKSNELIHLFFLVHEEMT